MEESTFPGYKVSRPSLDEAVQQSKTELEARASSYHERSLKERKEPRGNKVRATTPTNLREEERGSGPRKKTAKSSGQEESLPPEIRVRRDTVSGAESEEALWRQRKNEMFTR